MKIIANLCRRFRWINLPGAILMLLLQRTPILSVVAAVDEMVIASPVGAVLKSVLATAAALGAVNSLVGASALNVSAGTSTGITVPTGVPMSVSFSLPGSDSTFNPTAKWSLRIAGGSSFPPGLSFSGLTTTGTVNEKFPQLAGTPTTAGTYDITLEALSADNAFSSGQYPYRVIVTGSANTAPAITTQPVGQAVTVGNSVTFTAAASGTPTPTFQWKKDGVNIAGATNNSFTLASVVAGDAGSYTVVATNSVNSATSNPATLTVNAANTAPAFTTQPANQTVTVGNSVTFSAAASGTPTPTYQWKKGGVDIGGATGNTFTIASTVLGDAGTYTVVASNSVNSVTSNPANLTVGAVAVAPAFTTQPASQTVTAGNAVTLSAAASGTPTPAYQWKKGGVDIGGATGNTYTIVSTVLGDAGTYTVVATNSVNAVTSNPATLTVNPATTAPVFTTQPGNRTTSVGSPASFTAAASGTPAPTYQWKKDGVAIGGATGATYLIAVVGAGDAGVYTVVATNSVSSVASDPATLTLDVIPAGFNATAYLARYPEVAALFGADYYSAWIYYRDTGIYRGQIFDDLFRVEEYLALYPELFAVFGNNLGGALVHWLTQGNIEGRLGRIPLEFSAQGYLARNPDVAAAVNNDAILAWGHYWAYGIYEGRAYDDELRVFEYLAINADLTAAFVNDWRQAALHWMRYGRTEGRLGRLPLVFNATEYLNRNPDVAASWGTDPTTDFLHFWLFGIDEGRTFDDLFRVNEYLALNPDLAAVFGADRRGAFKHWVRYGMAEGRPGKNP